MRKKLLSLVVLLGVVGTLAYFGHAQLASGPKTDAAVLQSRLAATNKQEHPAEYYGLKRAQIALAEYNKGVAEQTPGCNCGPDIDKYTQGHHKQWCSMFASWVTMQAGSPVYSDATKSWRIPKSRDFAKYLQAHGTWHSKKEILRTGVEPQVGDFMIYWRGDNYDDNLGHIEIVTDPGNGNGTASMVGGNIKDKVYTRTVNYAQRDKLLGFGHPEK